MAHVAGIDSSTQSCKVVVRDADTGTLLRHGRGEHPKGTEIDPERWWSALQAAIREAGGLEDVAALSVGAQQHGMVCLDETGRPVRPALLWNDTRSAPAASDLIDELGGGDKGRQAWADAVGLVPVASFTVTKLRWMAQHEPRLAARTAAVALPHDWLTWRLAGETRLESLVTDRSDASGTGYWSAAAGEYRDDLFRLALGHDALRPRVLDPASPAGTAVTGAILGPGAGDNAAAALGLNALPGDVIVSIGTSGVASAVATVPPCDPSGTVAGFADATGRHLPLVCTLNAARVLDATAQLLSVTHDELDALALRAPAGADGLVVVPYLEGERTPDRPDTSGAIHGVTQSNCTPSHLARASVEGLLCGLADAVDALLAHGAVADRILLIGGGAKSSAVRSIAPSVFGRPIVVPEASEYVADGAARQAAWILDGGGEPPPWDITGLRTYEGAALPSVRARYAEARDHTIRRVDL